MFYMFYPRVLHSLFFALVAVISQPACSQSNLNDLNDKEQCQSDRLKMQMLGTRGPELWDKRASVSYLVWLDNKARVMIDAGSGSSQNFESSNAKFEDLDAILFTHFHVDHSADFMAYAKGGFFTDRTRDLFIIGPSASKFFVSADQFVERSIGNNGVYPYLNDFVNKDDRSAYKIIPQTLQWTDDNPQVITAYSNPQTGLSVKAVATRHGPVPAFAYRLEAAGCSIVFTGDMSGQMDKVPALAKNTQILVAHNAISEDATGVAARLHMKPSYIADMSARANVKHLLLTHLMRRSVNKKDETLQIIGNSYKGKVTFPDDLDIYWVK